MILFFLLVFIVVFAYQLVKSLVDVFRSNRDNSPLDDEKHDTEENNALQNELESIALQRDALAATLQSLELAYMEESDYLKKSRISERMATVHGKLAKLDKQENKIIELWEDG